jgi:hypothetical protein
MIWSRRAATGSAATFLNNTWCYLTNKIIDFVKDWLDSNITDELQPEVLKADSRDLLDKIKEMENDQ